MKDKSIIITDIDTPLGLELSKLFLKDGNRITGTSKDVSKDVTKSIASQFKDFKEEFFNHVPWKKHSPVSARNVVLSALNRFGKVDVAILLQVTGHEKKLYHDSYSSEIEREVDSVIKGTMFLSKEILKLYNSSLFNQNNAEIQILSIVYESISDLSYLTPLEAYVRYGCEGFVRSLDRLNDKNDVVINFFTAQSLQSPAKDQGYASFIHETLSDNPVKTNGRIIRYGGKKGLLGLI